jgi:hypothetical protein
MTFEKAALWISYQKMRYCGGIISLLSGMVIKYRRRIRRKMRGGSHHFAVRASHLSGRQGSSSPE